MIERLRRKFILVSVLSLVAVVAVMFGAISVFETISVNRRLDTLTAMILEGGGTFPDTDRTPPDNTGLPDTPDGGPQAPPGGNVPGAGDPPHDGSKPGFITGETRFSTRYFTVWTDAEGNVTRTETDAIHTVDDDSAAAYAQKILQKQSDRGWTDNFRYLSADTDGGHMLIFVDGSMNRNQARESLTVVAAVLGVCSVLTSLLIILLSGKVIGPAAESYRKQKQFITDANHELKTPLTLILTDLELAEAELGPNEWLADIRTEGQRMSGLIAELITLCRMDEEKPRPAETEFSLSDTVADVASEFAPAAKAKGKAFVCDIAPALLLTGDEGAVRRMLSVLFDNAVKYCDPDGEIRVTLKGQKKKILTVENTYRAAGDLDTERLFDRFYRADRARTSGSGFGIGLSIARAVAEAHHGRITAYRPDDSHVGFRVVFRA